MSSGTWRNSIDLSDDCLLHISLVSLDLVKSKYSPNLQICFAKFKIKTRNFATDSSVRSQVLISSFSALQELHVQKVALGEAVVETRWGIYKFMRIFPNDFKNIITLNFKSSKLFTNQQYQWCLTPEKSFVVCPWPDRFRWMTRCSLEAEPHSLAARWRQRHLRWSFCSPVL